MIRWILRFLRWLIGADPPSRAIEVVVDGELKRVVAQFVVGAAIQCTIPTSDGTTRIRVVTAASAVDQGHFWKLWRSMGGQGVWPDGTEFRPDK